jgi:hypothetical protein
MNCDRQQKLKWKNGVGESPRPDSNSCRGKKKNWQYRVPSGEIERVHELENCRTKRNTAVCLCSPTKTETQQAGPCPGQQGEKQEHTQNKNGMKPTTENQNFWFIKIERDSYLKYRGHHPPSLI